MSGQSRRCAPTRPRRPCVRSVRTKPARRATAWEARLSSAMCASTTGCCSWSQEVDRDDHLGRDALAAAGGQDGVGDQRRIGSDRRLDPPSGVRRRAAIQLQPLLAAVGRAPRLPARAAGRAARRGRAALSHSRSSNSASASASTSGRSVETRRAKRLDRAAPCRSCGARAGRSAPARRRRAGTCRRPPRAARRAPTRAKRSASASSIIAGRPRQCMSQKPTTACERRMQRAGLDRVLLLARRSRR